MRFPLLVLFTATVTASLHADVLVLKNGDRVTGSIIKKDAKELTIKSAHFGTINLPWAEVQSVAADDGLNIVLPGGQTLQGGIRTEGDKIEVGKGPDRRVVAPAEVVAIRNADEQRAYERLLDPGFGDLWAGAGSLGFAGTKGNAITQTLTTNLNAARVTNTDKTFLYFNTIKASALVKDPRTGASNNAGTAQAVRGGWGYNRNLRPRVFLNTFNDYEYDRFQNLDLRVVFGGGLGYNVVKTDRTRFDLLGGLAYNHERFNTPLIRNNAEGYWGDDFSYRLSAATTLFQSFRMFNNLKHGERYRMNFDLGATTRLTKWLTWNIGLSDRFLNVPAPGRKKNDFLYTTGLGVTFAR